MPDMSQKDRSGANKLVGSDELGNETEYAQIEKIDGIRRLYTTGLVQIEELFGQDNLPDTWFYIGTPQNSVGVGGAGDTIRVQILAGDNAVLFPAIDLTYIIVAGDIAAANSEVEVATNIVNMLNVDVTFKAQWKAKRISGNSTVHISSRTIAEFGQRPNSGDFLVTSTGTTVVLTAFDKIIARGKSTALTRDPSDPRLGVLGITGTVAASSEGIGRLYQDQPKSGGSPEMAINGTTPAVFSIVADAVDDIFIDELKFHGAGNGIQFGNFLNIANLTNGVLVEIRSDDTVLTFSLLKVTEDFKNKFSTGINWILEIVAGIDHMLAVFSPKSSFPIRKAGTFATDDYIHVTIQDNIAAIASLQMTANGFKKEP